MKNIKNILTAVTLSAVLAIGTTTATAGILIVGKSDSAATQCNQSQEASFMGLLMSDLHALASSARSGILITDRSGLLMSDRSGLLMSDRSQSATQGCQQTAARNGLLMSD